MTEPNEAMKAMARRVCARVIEGDSDNPLRVMKANRYLTGDFDDDHHMAIALAAIIETQEACAKVAEGWSAYSATLPPIRIGSATGKSIAGLIRTGNHYAKDESHG